MSMPSDTHMKIQTMIQSEISERQTAATQWDNAAGAYDHGGVQAAAHAEVCRARAFAAQNRAECHRLNRLKLERDIEDTEMIR